METEIKFLLDRASRSLVESHPAIADAAPQDEREVTTYFDTPDFELRRGGLSLRVRRAGRAFTQTLKATAASTADGALSRGEWEWRVAANTIDAAPVLAQADLRQLLDGDVLNRVGPVFATNIKRTKRRLRIEEGTEIEAALDEGFVRAGGRRAPICEVEFELKGGPPGPLFRLARDVSARAALRLGPESKAERGYELLTNASPPHADAADLALPSDVTVEQAFPQMIGASLRALMSELPRSARGDIESIHRLRASIRKLRTLLVLFEDRLEPSGAARFNAMLREFGSILGRGRDWDVFVTETLPRATETIGAEHVDGLRGAAEQRRTQAHEDIRRAIGGPLPTDLVLGLCAWTADAGWLHEGPGDEMLRDEVPSMLDALAKTVAKRGRRLGTLDGEDLHRLRKAAKKLRYASEDISSLFKAGPIERYLRRCKDLLQVLGTINDAAVTAEHARALGEGTDLADAASALITWNDQRRAGGLRKLKRRWKAFRDANPFWA